MTAAVKCRFCPANAMRRDGVCSACAHAFGLPVDPATPCACGKHRTRHASGVCQSCRQRTGRAVGRPVNRFTFFGATRSTAQWCRELRISRPAFVARVGRYGPDDPRTFAPRRPGECAKRALRIDRDGTWRITCHALLKTG